MAARRRTPPPWRARWTSSATSSMVTRGALPLGHDEGPLAASAGTRRRAGRPRRRDARERRTSSGAGQHHQTCPPATQQRATATPSSSPSARRPPWSRRSGTRVDDAISAPSRGVAQAPTLTASPDGRACRRASAPSCAARRTGPRRRPTSATRRQPCVRAPPPRSRPARSGLVVSPHVARAHDRKPARFWPRKLRRRDERAAQLVGRSYKCQYISAHSPHAMDDGAQRGMPRPPAPLATPVFPAPTSGPSRRSSTATGSSAARAVRRHFS